MSKKTLIPATAVALLGISALSGCASEDPLGADTQGAPPSAEPSTETIVIGSQDYYSNEIVAELYAQSLENAGYSVDRQFRIGQREVYLPEIEDGKIDLFPEYSGNLLQYWAPDAAARLGGDVFQKLVQVAPAGLTILDQVDAADQDSCTVRRSFAEEWDLSTIDDLAKVSDPMTLGGNSELETRPYGPAGLKDIYGVEVAFTPIEDAGGLLTIKALTDGSIQLANIYTADPAIAANDLTVLDDTKGLFLASHVVPVASERLDDGAVAVVNSVSAALSAEDLVLLNARSVDEELLLPQLRPNGSRSKVCRQQITCLLRTTYAVRNRRI